MPKPLRQSTAIIGGRNSPLPTSTSAHPVRWKMWCKRFLSNFGRLERNLTSTRASMVTSSFLRATSSSTDYVAHSMRRSSEEEVAAADLSERIDMLLLQLTPRQQEVYRLSRKDLLNYTEIAKRLHISERTVEKHLSDVLHYLREHLRPKLCGPK